MPPGCNVRVAAGLHIGIHPDCDRRCSASFFDQPGRLFHQNFEFCLRFGVEQQDSRPSASLAGSIIQRLANFIPLFPHTGKNDAVASYSDSLQVMKFSRGNNVESAAELRQMIQDGKISVGLYGKA